MHNTFLKIDLDALCRETASQIEGAGWDLDPAAVRNEAGMPGGPTIYLCHYEAQYAVMVRLNPGGIEQIQQRLNARGITFRDACNALGTVMDALATKKRMFDRQARNLLTGIGGLYLSGTQAYRIGQEQLVDQYLVIRHTTDTGGMRMLRPAATHQPGPLTPAELSELVVTVLEIDRVNHPERFKRDQPVKFRAQPL